MGSTAYMIVFCVGCTIIHISCGAIFNSILIIEYAHASTKIIYNMNIVSRTIPNIQYVKMLQYILIYVRHVDSIWGKIVQMVS